MGIVDDLRGLGTTHQGKSIREFLSPEKLTEFETAIDYLASLPIEDRPSIAKSTEAISDALGVRLSKYTIHKYERQARRAKEIEKSS